MKRKFHLLLACCLIVGMTGCGAKDNSAKTPDEGTYVMVNYNFVKKELFLEDLDQALDDLIPVMQEYLQKDPLQSQLSEIILKDGAFEMKYSFSTYKGSYEVVDNRLLFTYESVVFPEDYSDDASPMITVTPADTDGTYSELAKSFSTLNQTNTYFVRCQPQISGIDRYVDYGMCPVPILRREIRRTENEAVYLEKHGKFLCTETYGLTLESDYEHGKDFSITYNLHDMQMDDEYSLYYTYYLAEKSAEDYENYWNLHAPQMGFGESWKKDTTLQFSNGKWEWYNSEGDLINNGTYQESESYPGLIAMTIDEDSAKANFDEDNRSAENTYRAYTNSMPLFLYIAENGEIYYPSHIYVPN